ncbi:MAG: hypothetical protein ACSLFM_05060, partial [Tepidiformaceae bacterium]
MDGRLAILSGAAFLGVLVAGATATGQTPLGGDSDRGSSTALESAVLTINDDGTADQGSGDAPGTAGSSESTDDDGTTDQGSGDALGTASSHSDLSLI